MQDVLLACIDKNGWLRGADNQAMWFGALPSWAQELADGLPLSVWPHQVRCRICNVENKHQHADLLSLHMQILCRQPSFDQMIVNGYEPGEGISSHVDLLQFDDGIAIISLGSPTTMSFTEIDSVANTMPLTKESPSHEAKADQLWPNGQCHHNASVLHDNHPVESLQQNIHLQAGDVLLLQGEARYNWKHGIAFNQQCSFQSLERRVSITLRKLV